jgi:hypothetical protein
MEKNIFYIAFVVILATNIGTVVGQTKFSPDIDISGFELNNSESLKSLKLDTISPQRNSDPQVHFWKNFRITNESQNQILIFNFFPGGYVNEVAIFTLIDSKVKKDMDTPKYKTSIKEFITESGIKLGLSKEEVIKIKGQDFIKTEKGNEKEITYKIEDYENSPFLIKYNEVGYYEKFRFDNNKLVELEFGFEYP